MSLVVLPRTVEGAPRSAGSIPAPRPREAPAPRRHLRAVPDHQTLRRRRLTGLATVVLALAVAAGLMAIVTLHVMLAQGQVQVGRLEKRIATQERQQQELRLEVAALEAPQRVVEMARERLGMVPVDQVRYLTPPPSPSALDR